MFLLENLTKVVATYELPNIPTSDDPIFGSLRFVVQVLRLPHGSYVPRVMRKDRFNVEPAYYQNNPNLLDRATVELIVPDDSCDWESYECPSEEEALQRALDELKQLLAR